MPKVTCNNGHTYNTDIYGATCPFCPNEEKTQMGNAPIGATQIGNLPLIDPPQVEPPPYIGRTQIGDNPIIETPQVDNPIIETPQVSPPPIQEQPATMQQPIPTSTNAVNVNDILLAQQLRSLKKNRNGHRAAWIILLVINFIMFTVSAIFVIGSVAIIDDLERDAANKDFTINDLNGKLSKMQKVLPFKINEIEIGNCYDNDVMIDDCGSKLYASRMRYFVFEINYTSFLERSEEFTIYYRLYQPGGSLRCFGNSTTYSIDEGDENTIYTGNNSMTLYSWGNDNTSIFSAGVYRIEIWCNGMCIKSDKFKLY